MSVADFRAEVERAMIGSWKAGEIPAAFEYTFEDSNGAGIPLTPDFTGKLQWLVDGGGTLESRDLVIADQTASPGFVTYQWAAGDLDTVGTYDGEAWVGNAGTLRLASVDLGWKVRASLTPAPTV